MNLFERMLKITGELTAVAKNLTVEAGKYAYKAVGEADVLSAVKPLETKHGVYSYPYEREVILTDKLVTKSGTEQTFMRIKTVYRFVNIAQPDEHIDIVSYGDGIDTGDKAPGKAMTYADKYALLKAYKIITGDDPDQHASVETKAKSTMRAEFIKDAADMVKDATKDVEAQKRIMKKTLKHFGHEGKLQDFEMTNPTSFLDKLGEVIKEETEDVGV